MKKLFALLLLSFFAFTSCDKDDIDYYEDIAYSTWEGSVVNDRDGRTIVYTIAFDNEFDFTIIKALYDRNGLYNMIPNVRASEYRINGRNISVNIDNRAQKLRIRDDDQLTAEIYEEEIGQTVNVSFDRVSSVGMVNSQWVYDHEYRDGMGDMIVEVVNLKFLNGANFNMNIKIYRNGFLADEQNEKGGYSSYGNHVILHQILKENIVILVDNNNDELYYRHNNSATGTISTFYRK